MIFRENNFSRNFLPIIPNNQNEIKTERQEKSIIEEKLNNLLNLNVNQANNNRYNLQDKLETEINNDKEIKKEKEETKRIQTLTNTRNITNDSFLEKAKNPYIAKVVLEKISSKKDCLYILDEYFRKNNIKSDYEISNEQDKLIFSFNDENIAFEFTRLIYKEKNKNALYKNVKVNLSLLPNQQYLKRQNMEKKKKGISYERIMKLYNGSSYTKRIRDFPKIKCNLNHGLRCPFYNSYAKKKNLINSLKLMKNKPNNNRNYDGDINGYIGYDGLPLKNYEKLRISVLDTHYNPFSNIKYREDNKKKWMSPSNFKFY